MVRTRRGRVPPLRGFDRCSSIRSGRELERDHAIVEVYSRVDVLPVGAL